MDESEEEPNVFDFPPTIETENFKAWGDLEIKQKKGKLTVNKGEELYDIRIYPCRYEEKEFKFLSKIDKKTKEVTFILVSESFKTEEFKGPVEYYEDFVARFERDLGHVVDVELKKAFSMEDIINELKGN